MFQYLTNWKQTIYVVVVVPLVGRSKTTTTTRFSLLETFRLKQEMATARNIELSAENVSDGLNVFFNFQSYSYQLANSYNAVLGNRERRPRS